ncbi:MAG: PDZ domain-containing protein, partial [Hyphomicrobiales bacterium]|nr:PDZ domain-containing protein [Hyphomicrobiales bacterium]
AIAESLGLGKPRGALIAGVDDKGPSKSAGIRTGDVIVKFDGREVEKMSDLPRLVANSPVGKDVDVVVMRKGKEETLRVKLGRLPEKSTKQAALKKPEEVKPPSVVRKALGMEFSDLSDALRRQYKIKPSIKGVIITKVDPNSAAAEKQLVPGDTIVEINQQRMSKPEDVVTKLEDVKKAGRKSALLLVSNGEGNVRFVAVPVK